MSQIRNTAINTPEIADVFNFLVLVAMARKPQDFSPKA
jgi:hypothetical protein